VKLFQTANFFKGFYDTMDAGYMDDEGYVYVTARDDDIINVAGHRLSTNAIEDVVMTHPCVVDAAVVGVPDATKGHTPLCLYVMAPGQLTPTHNISVPNSNLFQARR
jgi:propionyl-CoA synthetase